MASRLKLGILLTTSPESRDVETVTGIAGAALDLGHPVEIFLMADGVYNLLNEGFRALLSKGATVTVCAHNAGERGLGRPAGGTGGIEPPRGAAGAPDLSGVVWGSQFDLARSVHSCAAFLSFT